MEQSTVDQFQTGLEIVAESIASRKMLAVAAKGVSFCWLQSERTHIGRLARFRRTV